MDNVIGEILSTWGTVGILIVVFGYMAWDSWKAMRDRKNNNDKAMTGIELLGGKIDNINTSIKLVDQKVETVKEQFDEKIKDIESQIHDIPKKNSAHIDKIKAEGHTLHLKQLDDLMKLGPKLHKIIKDANDKIGSDHIFVGSFHNGNSSLSGIPYYKFDIIAERFSVDKVEQDTEFAHMYKDADILRYDTLPVLLVQQGQVYFDVPESGENEMEGYDDIIWRRMKGRGIRQIALRLTRDSKGSPSGFVGVVKYNHDELKLNYLDDCGRELEEMYKESELKEKNQ
jgi:hypothetical protein